MTHTLAKRNARKHAAGRRMAARDAPALPRRGTGRLEKYGRPRTLGSTSRRGRGPPSRRAAAVTPIGHDHGSASTGCRETPGRRSRITVRAGGRECGAEKNESVENRDCFGAQPPIKSRTIVTCRVLRKISETAYCPEQISSALARERSAAMQQRLLSTMPAPRAPTPRAGWAQHS